MLRVIATLYSAGALFLTPPWQVTDPIISASSFQDAIQSLETALRDQDRSLQTDDDVIGAFSSIDTLRLNGMNLLRQTSRISLSMEEQFCAEPFLIKLQSDLQVIGEYFSVSNDGSQKMMVGDAFQSQKLNFIKQGIAASRAELRELSRCIR